ncbi:MAG: HAD hydrolase family protein, partial [Treponema sp.]|nr:HAD hydrolase family protein [Treponema sp.]
TFNDFSDFREPGMKLCIQTLDAEKVARIADTLGPDMIDFLPFSDIPWYKLSKKHATKEKAIEALCAHLQLSPDRIAAFGDDFNDIGMLKLCGRGIAMENAIAEVKQAADEICRSNEQDGVARWIADRL